MGVKRRMVSELDEIADPHDEKSFECLGANERTAAQIAGSRPITRARA
jgi:hypothetical protein